MRNLKKILALVLALVMSLSLMATAGAASFPDVADDNAYKTAIDVLNGVKVFQGYDNGARFEPAGNITRAEVAAIIYRISTGDVNDTQKDIYTAWNGAGKLSDVTTGWYAGYVNFCSNAGYIKGYPDKTFKPQNNVTGYEVLAMILRAVGYGRNGEFEGSQWAITTASLAQTLGITKNVKEDLGAPATRQMVAEILFRAIFCETQKYNALHLYEGTGTNLARENLSLEEVEGVVIANEYAHLEGTRTLADGKTLVRDEKNEKDYTINWSTNLDDMGESRLIYIQSKTNVISLADSGKNAKAESTDAEKVSAVLDRAGISEGDAEKFLNFDKAFKRDSEYKIKYVLKADDAGKINGVLIADVKDRINAAADDTRAKIVGDTVEVIIVKRNPITDVDMDYMERIFGKADKKNNAYIDGEVYVGTQSTNDISDVDADQKYSWESFCEEFILETENDQAFTANDNGNWVKVIDNDADGVADYIFKVIYTVAQVTRVKDDVVTLDTKNHSLTDPDGDGFCTIDAINNLTDEKVVSADELVEDDVVYYAVIENKAQTYKAAMETATFKDVSRNGQTAVTSDGTEWTQSDVCEHIEDEAFDHNVRRLAGKVSYDCYFDRGGYLAAFVKTDKVGDFKLITDGWFNALKSRNDEYAVNAYNDAESKLEVIDITKYGDLFVASAAVQHNGWDGLKFLGGTQGGKVVGDTAEDGILGVSSGAALNGDNVTAGSVQEDVIHTTVAAITADGTILPVHDASVTGRYDHEMIDLYDAALNNGKAVIPTMKAVDGTIYYTENGSDTAYNKDGDNVQVRALSSTIYYVVWGNNASARVLSFTGYDNAPSMSKLAGLVEDVYCVGTRRAADNDTDNVTYSADVVVIELNKPYPDDKEPFFVVDNDWRRTDIGDYRVDGIDKNGEKIEDMRVTGFNWRTDRFAYAGSGIADDKQINPGLYWRTKVGEDTYKLVPMSPADIAANFSVGTVTEKSWTDYIVMQSWNEDTAYGYGPDGTTELLPGVDFDAGDLLLTSDEKQYKITSASLYTLAYGGDDYQEYSAELDKADVKEVIDWQVDDYVVDREGNTKLRDTWFNDNHNWHYYNRNKVLVYHGDSNAAAWVVSFANVVDEGHNYDDQDYAWSVWADIVERVPANIYTGNAITVMGQTYDGTTWTVDTETNAVGVAGGLNVSDVVNNVAYAETEDGVELTLTAPAGKVFYENAGTGALKETANAALIHSWNFNGDKTELKLTLKDITGDVTLTFGLKAAGAGVNDPKITVTDNKIKADPATATYNATLTATGPITFKMANSAALTANQKVEVKSVKMGSKELTRGAAEDGYTVAADGHSITLAGTTQITDNIVIDATLKTETTKNITLTAAGYNGAQALAAPTLAEFTIAGAKVGTKTVFPEGVERYPATGSSFTFKVDVGDTLVVSLSKGDYAYSNDVTIATDDGGSFFELTIDSNLTTAVVIDDASRFATAKTDASLAIGPYDLTGAATAKEALEGKIPEISVADTTAKVGKESNAVVTDVTKTVDAPAGVTVYKVIAENKDVQYYAVKVTKSEGTVTTKPEVTDGAATVAPDAKEIQEAITAAGSKKEVTISAKTEPAAGAEPVTSTTVTLDADVVAAVTDKENSGKNAVAVTVETNHGTVTVPASAITKAIGETKNPSVAIVVSEVKASDTGVEVPKVAVLADVTVKVGSEEATLEELTDKITITLPVTGKKDGEAVDIYYVKDSKLEKVATEVEVKGGSVTFEVDHLTTFVLDVTDPTEAKTYAKKALAAYVTWAEQNVDVSSKYFTKTGEIKVSENETQLYAAKGEKAAEGWWKSLENPALLCNMGLADGIKAIEAMIDEAKTPAAVQAIFWAKNEDGQGNPTSGFTSLGWDNTDISSTMCGNFGYTGNLKDYIAQQIMILLVEDAIATENKDTTIDFSTAKIDELPDDNVITGGEGSNYATHILAASIRGLYKLVPAKEVVEE